MCIRDSSGTALRDDTPARPTRGEGDERFRQVPANEPIGTRCHRFSRVRPVDSSRVIPASELVSARRRFLGMEEFLETRCPCCGPTDANTRYVRLCHRSGAQVNQHQPLVHALSRTVKRMSIRRICYGIGVSQQSDTARLHVCRPTGGGPHACRQR